MYKIYYKVRSAKRDGTGTVYVMLRCANGEEVTRTTGVSVVTKEFNTITGKVSVKDILHLEKNEAIRNIVLDLEQAASLASHDRNIKVELTKAGIESKYAVATQLRLGQRKFQAEFVTHLATSIPAMEDKIKQLQQELSEAQRVLRSLRGEDENAEEVKRDLFTDRIDEYIRVAMT